MTLPISERAITEIESFEIGPRAQYNTHVTWPGGASGLTWGVGYDGGHESAAQILADWGDLLPGAVARLQSYAGRTGRAAQSLAYATRDIVVPWAAAETVFRSRNIPRYTDMTAVAFAHCDELSPNCLGALVSLVFNRGASMSDPVGYPGSRAEMRQIRDAMAARRFADVPSYIRGMKRLWVGKGLDGLLARRDAEAALFEAGLSDIGIPITEQPQPVRTAENSSVLTTDDLNAAELQRIAG